MLSKEAPSGDEAAQAQLQLQLQDEAARLRQWARDHPLPAVEVTAETIALATQAVAEHRQVKAAFYAWLKTAKVQQTPGAGR